MRSRSDSWSPQCVRQLVQEFGLQQKTDCQQLQLLSQEKKAAGGNKPLGLRDAVGIVSCEDCEVQLDSSILEIMTSFSTCSNRISNSSESLGICDMCEKGHM